MSYDPSKIEYWYPFSKPTEAPLHFEVFACKVLGCSWVGYTVNQQAEHSLDRHAAQLHSMTSNGSMKST